MKHSSIRVWGIVIFLMFISSLFFSACENEVNINADYKETIVIYALLDPEDTIQYIKVNKAYLNEGIGALEAAKISDSLYLDSTHVQLKRLNTGQIIICNAEEGPKKDSGIFANDKNILWATREKIYPNEEYEITVSNPVTKTKAVSVTKTVGPAKIRAPFIDQTNIFSLGPEYINVSYVAATNAFSYDIQFQVFYEEFSTADTGKKITKMATWKMITNFLVGNVSSPIRQIPRLSFLQFLQNSITASPTLKHRIKWVGITMYGANQTLIDYISVNEPSIGIVQKQADYTNITGGYGLFASRCKQTVWGIPMDPASIVYLQKHELTKALNLVR
jgi:hypothetical protein